MLSKNTGKNIGRLFNPRVATDFLSRIRIALGSTIAVTVAVAGNPVHSQVPEHYYFDEVPVVLSVTRLHQPLADTPASVTIIDKEMIRASGATNIPDLLRHVPGFQVGFVTGKRAAVTAHGRGDEFARDMQIKIDGRSIYDPAYGGVSWQDLPLDIDDIHSIEVVRGPNAASHGSNSFAGIVNIVTEHPAEQQGILLKTRVGEGQNREHTARYAGSADRLDYRISASRTEDDGFDSRVDSARTNAISFRGDYRADSENSFMLQLGHSSGPRGEGFPSIPGQPPSDQPSRQAYHINHFQQLRWSRQPSADEELRVEFYHNYQKKDDHFQVELEPAVAAGYGFDSHRYDAELQYSDRLNDQLRLVTGFGGRYESAEGVWTFGEKGVSRNQLRAFSNVEWTPINDTVFNFGAMYEVYQGKRGLLSPRFAVNHHLNAANTLRFAASRAYRMPTLFEDNARLLVYRASDMLPLDYFFLSQEDLEPEQITSYEVGYLGNFPAQALTLDVRLFNERIHDIIPNIDNEQILGPIPLGSTFDGAQSYTNNGKLTISGVELDLKYRPVPNSLIHVGYSLTNMKGEQLRRIRADGALRFLDMQDSIPEQTFSLLGSYRFDNGIEISSAFHYIDPVVWLYEGAYVPVQTRWDLRIGKRFRSSKSEFDLQLVWQNIDGEDIDFYNDPDKEPAQVNVSDKRLFVQARVYFN